MMEQIPTRDVRRASLGITQQDSVIDQQKAVVVGIGDYGGAFSALPNAPHDANAVGGMLQHDYGFELVPAAVPLIDKAAGRGAVVEAVEKSLQEANDGTRWLFYFAGHGVVAEDGQGYLVPADAWKSSTVTYLSLRWLIDRCLASACAETLIVLDACYGGRALVRPEYLVDWHREDGTHEVIRQIVTSGNPDQPVLDGGGSGHSVFTQSLLEALEGWAGIHQDDGAIDFESLLSHLVFEVPMRLRALGESAALQQPIGGNLIGKRRARGFTLEPLVPRLSPTIVQRTRSDDPTDRGDNLAKLASECQDHPERCELAVELAKYHLRRPGEHPDPLVAGMLRYEPVVSVRAQAADTLGDLADPAAVEPLTAALDDVPEVCRAAARALGQLGDPHAAPALLERLKAADDTLFPDLVGAIGAVQDPDALLEALREARRRNKLVPFVGPDFPQALTGLPDRATVAHGLADREGLPPSDSLAATAQATMRGGKLVFAYVSYMKNKLDDQLARPGTIHEALARLDLPFWISGAYDGLLVRALNANSIVSGEDTRYWRPERPTVVCLAGDLSSVRGLLAVESDYEQLRENEGDRHLLVSYLREQLQGQVVLFLGYDPQSPDLALLVKHVLNGHLAGADVRAFLSWPRAELDHQWGQWPIQPISRESLAFVEQLH